MANDNIKAELAALRAEVASLAAARKQTAEPEEPKEAAMATDQAASSDDVHEGFMSEVQELIEVLEQELRDTPLVSGLAVFGLGILVGRFLR